MPKKLLINLMEVILNLQPAQSSNKLYSIQFTHNFSSFFFVLFSENNLLCSVSSGRVEFQIT